ncbi:MAG: diguanylate cyclase [Candidatus Brocadiae bacterium]|nr:diguanylate cyclase [Candidatus Brocadiia bacterium]
MMRGFWGPVLTVATLAALLNVAALAWVGALVEQRRSSETDRIRASVTAAIWRHVRGVEALGARGGEPGGELTRVYPALVAVSRLSRDGAVVSAVELPGAPPGASRPSSASEGFRRALSGAPAVDDPHPGPGGETLVAVWAPATDGVVTGVFRLDRLIGDAVDEAVGDDAEFVLTDSRGRRPSARGADARATLLIPLTLHGLSWTLHVSDRDASTSPRFGLVGLAVFSLASLVGFAAFQRRAVADAAALAEKVTRVEELSAVELRERGRLLTLLDSLDESVVLAGPDGSMLTCNSAGDRLLGGSPEFTDAGGAPVAAGALPVARAITARGRVTTDDIYLKRDGRLVPLSAIAAPLLDPDRNVLGAVAVYRDMSRQREWEETVRTRDFALTVKNKLQTEMHESKTEEEILRRLNYHLEAALQPASMNIFLRRSGSDVLRAERTTGLKPVEGFEPPVLGNPSMCPVLETGEAQDPRTCSERVQPCLGRITPGSFLCAPIRIGEKVEGTIHLELGDAEPADWKIDLSLDLIRLAGAAIQARRYVDMMSQAAIRDPLTGLYNRRHFDETGRVMMSQARRYSKALGVLMIDIDHFKQFNDNYGHDAGDVVLREFSRALRTTARSSDLMVRYGGEEFAVLLSETPLAQAKIAAERIVEATRKIRLPIVGLELGQVTVSVGVASFPEHGDALEVLVKAADQALYAAKNGGRNCARVAEPGSRPPALTEPRPA